MCTAFAELKKLIKALAMGWTKEAKKKKTAVFNETQITLMIITPKSGTIEGRKKSSCTHYERK